MDQNPPSMATLIIGDKTLDVDDYEEQDYSESPEILKKKKAQAKKASGSGSK
jgi:hypothetical protein